MVADADAVIRIANAAAHEIFAYDEPDLVGKRLTSLLPAAQRSSFLEGLPRGPKPTAARPAPRKLELTGLRKDGSEFPMEFSLSVWRSGATPYSSAA